MINFEDIPLDFIKKIKSENEIKYICILYDMFNLYKDLKKRGVKNNQIYNILSDKYNLSLSGIKQIFSRKLNKIL